MLKLIKTECSASDRFELTARTITPQGFLIAPAVIARTGVQTYRAGELGIACDSGPNTQIRLYRSPEEVFHQDSITSFDGVPVTMGHPPGNRVDAKNWRNRAVGDIGDVAGKDPILDGKITVRDAAAVTAVDSGKKFLSAGYLFTLDPTPGTAPDGQAYDGVMRNIRGNHVAIVDVPRGGPLCRIADSNSGGKPMRKFVVDGISIEIEDSTTADVFAKVLGERDEAKLKLASKVKIGDQEFTIGDAAVQTSADALVKQITELKAKQVTPEQIEKQVAGRVKLVGDALKLLPGFTADGKTDLQIQREVITAVTAKDENAKKMVASAFDGVTLEAADQSLLGIAFRLLSAAPKTDGTHSTSAADAAMSAALTRDNVGADSKKPVGRDAYNSRNENAWQGKTTTAQ